MTTVIGDYTPGCIRSEDGRKTLLNQAEIDRIYRLEDGHFTRSYVTSVMEHGGPGQQMLDNGERLFTGNAGTDFGTLVDRAIPATICGHDLESLYAVPPDEVLSNGARRGSAYTSWKADLGDRSEISGPDWYRLTKVIDNVWKNAAARQILEETQDCQATARWTDEDGHKRKSLFDGLCPGFAWDFKTTSSSWKDLYRSCLGFGYIVQDAWYEDGAVACGWEPHRLRFIFAQSQRPFGVRVYTFPQDLVDLARSQIRQTLDQISLRRELGLYHSPEDEECMELEFPAWTRGGD